MPEMIMSQDMSGEDTGSYPTQWALNPNAYQNVDVNQVDWAALAQQWIIMKEACTTVVPTPPPPPSIKLDNADKAMEEKGEAPMDVENTDNSDCNAAWSGGEWSQWGWGWPAGGSKEASEVDYSTASEPRTANYSAVEAGEQTYHMGYWTANSTGPSTMKSTKKYDSRHSNHLAPRNRPPLVTREVSKPIMETTNSNMMDAAKRRQLPAWIREGLEKMEREKQRQMEKEQLKQLEQAKNSQEQIQDHFDGHPPKSKFESDSSDEEPRDVLEHKAESEDLEIAKSSGVAEDIEKPIADPVVFKTKEEIMQDMMVCVRRTITEILLEVTDAEIRNIASEELQRYSSLQGLAAAYGSGSDSDSDSEDEVKNSSNISDNQLKDIIKRRQLEFELMSRQIEAEIREDEENERETPSPPPNKQRKLGSSTPNEGTQRSIHTPDRNPDKMKERLPETPKRTSSDSKDSHRSHNERVKSSGHDQKKKNDTKEIRSETPSPQKKSETSSESDDSSDSSSDSESSSSSESSESSDKSSIKSKQHRKRSSSDSPKKTSRKRKEVTKDKINKDEFSIDTKYKSKDKKEDHYSRTKYHKHDEYDRYDDKYKRRSKRSRSRSRDSYYYDDHYRSGKSSRSSGHKRSRDRESSRRRSRDKDSSRKSARGSRDRESSRKRSRDRDERYSRERYYDSVKRSYRH